MKNTPIVYTANNAILLLSVVCTALAKPTAQHDEKEGGIYIATPT